MKTDDLSNAVETVRKFSRFYTRKIGALADIPYPLAEARIIYELASGESSTATELREKLDLDAGYLSRILNKQQRSKLIEKKASPDDARKSILSLTPKGRSDFAVLDGATRDRVAAMLKDLSTSERQR